MCREFTTKSHTEESPNIFRDYEPKRKGGDQLDASRCTDFPCIKQATALEDFEDYDEDLNFFCSSCEDVQNMEMGTLSLYENDRIGSCSSDDGEEAFSPDQCFQRYEPFTNYSDDHVSHVNAEWILSPSQLHVGSPRVDEPPALKSNGRGCRGEDAFSQPLFLRIPAGHVPIGSNIDRPNTSEEMNIESVDGTPAHGVRLAPRPVTYLFSSSKTFPPADCHKVLQAKGGKQKLSNLMLPLF